MSDKAGEPGKGAPKWLQEGKGTSQPLPPARCKTLTQCVGNTWNSLDIKCNSKTGISPLPHNPTDEAADCFPPPYISHKGHSCQAEPHCLAFTLPSSIFLDKDGTKRSCETPEALRVHLGNLGKRGYCGYHSPHILSEYAAN